MPTRSNPDPANPLSRAAIYFNPNAFRSPFFHGSDRGPGKLSLCERHDKPYPGHLEPPNSIVKGVSGADLLPCALSNFRGKGKLVYPSTSSSTNPPRLQGFTPATRAQSTRAIKATAKARLNSSNDPYGARRVERSKAKTPAGYVRVANSVLRELIGLPLTRKQQDEIRAQRPRLRPEEIDKNANRRPAVRQRAPRDMPKRRRPGWVCRQFVLPRPIVEGLMFLAKAKAQEEFAERSSEPRGLRRRYPKTANFYVTEAVNALLDEYGLSQFCVPEAESATARVRRFVVPGG